MESKEQEDKPENTGIWTSTFASKQDEHVTDQGDAKEMSRSTPKEPTVMIGSKVSPFPIVLSEEPLFDSKEDDMLPSDTNIVEHDAGKTRSRTLTSKGREYQCELKKKAALANDRDLQAKLRSLEEFIHDCKNPDEIRREIADMAKEVNEVQRSFDEWIELSVDTSESQRASNKQSYIYDTWKIIHATAVQEIKRLEDDVKSVYSRRSQRSRTSTKSGSSRSSYRETLLACRAKRAALQEKLKFSSVIAEQENKLEQLKIQKELVEIAAQEAVYKTALDEENELNDEQQPLLPTAVHDPIDAFLNSNEETKLTLTSQAAIFTPTAQETSAAHNVSVTSLSSTPFVEPLSQSVPPTSVSTPPVPSVQETQRPLNPFSPVYTTAKFSSGGQSPPIIPAISTTMSEHQLTTPRGFCGNPPAFFPSPVTTCSPVSQNYTAQITDALAKITQLQRLPQATPSVFEGSDSDKTKFFLWEDAVDSLIDSAPVTAKQKLHLLYQYLGGKAKRVVEQLQYLVENPEGAYREARRILKERFGNPAIISTDFEKKLANWPKIGLNDTVGLEEFSDFLQQVKIASKHIESLKVLNYPSQIQALVEKLPGWFKAKWSDKVLKFQKKRGKDAFPPFEEFAEEVRYHAERTNIPQILQSPGTTGSIIPDRNKRLGRQSGRNRSSNVALTSTSPAVDDSEATPPHEESQVASIQAQQPNLMNTPASNSQSTRLTTPPNSGTYCFYHKMKSHAMNDCEQFQKLSYEERKDFLMKNRICLKCVSSNKHVSKDCSKDKLQCKICQQKHATVLHDPTRHKKEEPSRVNSACSQVCGRNQPARSCARIVLLEVFHQDNPSAKVPTYAVLDDQSTDVFIADSLLEQLGVQGQEVNLEINTITGANSVRTQKVNGLHIQDMDSLHKSIKVPFAYSQEKIPASQEDIATPGIARSWKHLEGIAHHIHHRTDIEIGLLIGRNIPSAFQPLRIIYGTDNEPWAEEYKFGWTVIGPVCLDKREDSANCATVNRIAIQRENPQNVFNVPTSNSSKEDSVVSFATKHYIKDVTSPQQVRGMMQLDYSELHYTRSIPGTEKSESVEDKRFCNTLTANIHKNENGNWEMPLPFKTDNVTLPHNRDQCLKRLLGIKRKLLKNSKTLKHYTEFMQKIFDKNHASPVPPEELKTSAGKVWYLPHFDIYHPKKQDQIRIVFDCSAVFQDQSLNKHLLQGPDMMNGLVGVLSRFRKEETAVTCDIEQMFHSFHVNPEHRDFLRFLWFKDNDLNGQICEYRMNVHLFGAVSSPGVANFGLRATAETGREQFGQAAADFLQQDFYVDDGLKSFPTPEDAIDVISKTKAMCKAASLRLHKFASNSKTVLEAMPAEDRSKDLKDLDLRHDVLPVQRSLGTYWCIETDTIGFRIELKDKPLTRRGILSTVSSVYDPLGIVAPVILVGKQLLQELCHDGIEWDDPVPSHVHSQWEKWRSELPLLEKITIARCVKPPSFGEPVVTELHSFSDASDVGLGQVTYLRLVNNSNQVHVSFLMGKARVAPLKPMSTPRRELTAAVISANVASMLSRELKYKDPVEVFYTDSSVVLGYIHNEAKRFHTYVGNRVHHIHDRSKPQQWHYVASSSNPADIASRGTTAKQLSEHELWFKGPSFLWEKDVTVENVDLVPDLSPEDAEVKKVKTAVLISNQVTPQSKEEKTFPEVLESDRFHHSSSPGRLKRSIVRIQRMIEKKRPNKQYNTRPIAGPPTVEEMRLADEVILKSLQFGYFGKEIRVLQNLRDKDPMFQNRQNAHTRNEKLKQTSSLFRLDPFLDEKGLLRIGGRLQRATLAYEVKHPIVVPKKSHITDLLIRQYHSQDQYHQGCGMTHNALRQAGYWIINGRSSVSRHLRKCTICRKLRGPAQVQKMANLPAERITPAAPFTYSGMDVFGPWYIKEGRKELKRWGLIFTCLSSRAVHLETLNSMETDAFINALRRFINRRGKVRELRCDQGTNFVGGRNELNAALREVNTDSVKNFLVTQDCDLIEFKMNVPSASHMGGIWERLIRTVRSVLSGLLEDHAQQLDDESLRTLFTEAENIVNSRPLTIDNLSDPDAPEPITPNHLLTLKAKVVLPPPGNFSRPDLYSRRRWRRIQYLSDQFWRRWQREYCLLQQKRQKWNEVSPNSQVGDIVLISDKSCPRNQWPLARVTEVYPSEDGLVRKVLLLVTQSGKKKLLERPIHKLILIFRPNEDESDT